MEMTQKKERKMHTCRKLLDAATAPFSSAEHASSVACG
jgi:hypothetical protein